MKHSLLKRTFLSLLLVAAALTVPAAPLFAEEEKPTGDFSTAVLNQYIWRGYELSRNSVAIQPSLTVGYKGFTANLWGNIDTKPYSAGAVNYSNTWNETDLTLSYTKNLGLFNVGGGYIYYSLGSLNKDAVDRADSQEIFATLSLNTLLSPTLTVYKEIDRYKQWYFLLGVSHAFELNKMVSLKLAATASYLKSTYADAALFNAGAGYGGYPKFDGNAAATDDKFSNFHDGTVTASLPIKATDRITVTPTLSYIFPLSGDAKDEMKGNGLKGTAVTTDRDSSFIVGGLTASFSF
ncbi:MAG: hypothetical protein M0009_16610 [Deltaproteobacteria bacterium]|nr:hypothetical protein [Deltaproteobacteria bacterium]